MALINAVSYREDRSTRNDRSRRNDIIRHTGKRNVTLGEIKERLEIKARMEELYGW
jgi:hypothetical protein